MRLLLCGLCGFSFAFFAVAFFAYQTPGEKIKRKERKGKPAKNAKQKEGPQKAN